MKFLFITGASCTGKSTRFSYLWDYLSDTYEYEDVVRDITREHPRKGSWESKDIHLARRFPEISVTLIGKKSKAGWVSMDQFKNYKYNAEPSANMVFDLAKEFEEDTVIAEGVSQFYGKYCLPSNLKEQGINSVEWIVIVHDDLEEAVDRSLDRLKQSGKSRSGKKETNREDKRKTLSSADKSVRKLVERFNEESSNNAKVIEASSSKEELIKIIKERINEK